MITNKSYYSLVNTIFPMLFLMSNMALYGQKELSHKEMEEDINFLVQTIKEVNPHLTIREQITYTPIRQEIDSLQQTVGEVKSFEEFYYLAQKILLVCQDQHDNFQGYYPSENEEDNPFISNETIEISKKCVQNYDNYFPGNSFLVDYVKGEYFFGMTHYDSEGNTLIPSHAKLLSINDIPIDEYIFKYNRPIDNSVKWDFAYNKYYTYRIFFPTLIGIADNTNMTYSINDSIYTLRYEGSQIGRNAPEDAYKNKVLYFPKNHILYIRIPSMDMGQLDFYIQNILKYKNEPIEKIVIDIRSNGGGNDRVWMEVMSTIRENPFSTKIKCYVRNTPTLKNYLPLRDIEINENDTIRINQDIFAAIVDTDNKVKPIHPSLNYTGKIYVLVNDRCFSSALAFSATCNHEENIITVGQASGYIGGRGITPLFFSLPNSRLIFSISPVLDATGVETVEDYYDRCVKMPISVPLDEIIFEKIYEGERYAEFYLYNHDSVFKEVLKQRE
jgi:hypothetical protein